MTGETSDTRIAELAERIADDGRPAVILYFSDHDPSGWQMPISVSRKLQALRDLFYPGLDLQVRRAALTAVQAKRTRSSEHAAKGHREARRQLEGQDRTGTNRA